MKTADIYNTLKDDKAFQHAIETCNLIDLGVILRAHGFGHTYFDITEMAIYCGLPEKILNTEIPA